MAAVLLPLTLLDASPGANSSRCQVSGTCSPVQKSLIHLSIAIMYCNFFFQLSSTMLLCLVLHSSAQLDVRLLQWKAQWQEIYFSFVCLHGLLCSLRIQTFCNYDYLSTLFWDRNSEDNFVSYRGNNSRLTILVSDVPLSLKKKRGFCSCTCFQWS